MRSWHGHCDPWRSFTSPWQGSTMESRAKFLAHPIHQMLILLPLGLLTASVGFEVGRRFTRERAWRDADTIAVSAGPAGALVAAPTPLHPLR
jgi:uncharacterized membrane protein